MKIFLSFFVLALLTWPPRAGSAAGQRDAAAIPGPPSVTGDSLLVDRRPGLGDEGRRHADRHFHDLRNERSFRAHDRWRSSRPPGGWHDRRFGAGEVRRYELHRHRDFGIHDHRSLLERDRHFFGNPRHIPQPHLKRYAPDDTVTVCYRTGSVLVCYGG